MRNRAKCRQCGDIIESKWRHDFVQCKCGAIAVDGGMDYFKRSGEPNNFLDVPEDEDEDKLG